MSILVSFMNLKIYYAILIPDNNSSSTRKTYQVYWKIQFAK